MVTLTSAQQRAYAKLGNEPKSGYQLKESLPTLRALCRLGKAKDVTPPGAGGMFSPTTHYKFVKVG